MSFLLFVVIFSAFLGALLFYWVTKFLLKKKLKKRFDRASLGELEAEDLLKSYGYQLEQTQKSSWLSMWIDGEETTYLVRPDAYACRGNQRYLVEIKTGPQATNPKLCATRRQLLEYYYSFKEVDGILLINADQKKILHVHFEEPEPSLKKVLIQTSKQVSKHAQTSL